MIGVFKCAVIGWNESEGRYYLANHNNVFLIRSRRLDFQSASRQTLAVNLSETARARVSVAASSRALYTLSTAPPRSFWVVQHGDINAREIPRAEGHRCISPG